jgi:hypothetical protein
VVVKWWSAVPEAPDRAASVDCRTCVLAITVPLNTAPEQITSDSLLISRVTDVAHAWASNAT